MAHEYDEEPRLVYGEGEFAGATFVRRCNKCFRFVKPRETVIFRGSQPNGPNADCARCGPTQMLFEGYY